MEAIPSHLALAGRAYVSMTRDEALDLASEIEEAYSTARNSDDVVAPSFPGLRDFHRRLCEAFDLHRQPL